MRFKICVTGAAEGSILTNSVLEKARIIGEEIAKADCVLLTGATKGIPHHTAIGAKKADGISIGFSPAISRLEHERKYRLPTQYTDLIVYTGFGYSRRNLLMVRSSEAVIVIGGRIGTLNEFTNAFEEGKPIGVLLDSGGISSIIPSILEVADKKAEDIIIFDTDPKELVRKIVSHLNKEHHIGHL